MQLLTIPFSHFCEKARWGLDRARVNYREVRFAPVAQRFAVMPLGSLTVPVLVDAPHAVRGSNDILSFADRELQPNERLWPEDPEERRQAAELVDRFDEIVAPNVRRWFYSWAIDEPERLREYSLAALPKSQQLLMRATLPAISRALTMHFKLADDTHASTAEIVTTEFDFVSDLLSDGRDYLVGDRLSAADIAFASFVGATIGAPNYGGTHYTPPPRPEALSEQSDHWRDSVAGQWVHGLYAAHR